MLVQLPVTPTVYTCSDLKASKLMELLFCGNKEES